MYFNHEKVGRDIEFESYIPNLLVNTVGDIHATLQYPYKSYTKLGMIQEVNAFGIKKTNFYIKYDDNLKIEVEFKEQKDSKIRTKYEVLVSFYLEDEHAYNMGYIEKIEDARSQFRDLFLLINAEINNFNKEFECDRYVSREDNMCSMFNNITVA